MILFVHGMEGSPRGAKVRALSEAGLEVEAPDFTGLTLAARVSLLEEATRPGQLVLAGSSYGGLAAALVAQRFPGRFRGLLLCAPALELAEPPAEDPQLIVAPPPLPTVVIHGIRDDVVPGRGRGEVGHCL